MDDQGPFPVPSLKLLWGTSALEVPTDIRIFAHPNDSLREQISVHPNNIPPQADTACF